MDRFACVSDPSKPTRVNTLIGHKGSVKALAFSHDGRTLASGSRDGTVRIWQVMPNGAANHLDTLPLGGQPSAHIALSFRPNHSTLSIVVVPLASNVTTLPENIGDAISKGATSAVLLALSP